MVLAVVNEMAFHHQVDLVPVEDCEILGTMVYQRLDGVEAFVVDHQMVDVQLYHNLDPKDLVAVAYVDQDDRSDHLVVVALVLQVDLNLVDVVFVVVVQD